MSITKISRILANVVLVLLLCPGFAPGANPPLTKETKLTPSDGTSGTSFGEAVAISGDTVVVGAEGSSNAGSYSGAAYVFVRGAGGWSRLQTLTASDAEAGDEFGRSVAVSGDTIVAGSPLDSHHDLSVSGSAYVFARSGGVWQQQEKLTADDAGAGDEFGWSVAVSGDTAIVGSPVDDDDGNDSGSAYVFVRIGGKWFQQQKLTASDAFANDYFGLSVAVSGDIAVVGAIAKNIRTGAAYVFVRTGGVWTERQKLTASDGTFNDDFGGAVAVSGDTVVVGAVRHDDGGESAGSAYVFVRNEGIWNEQQKLGADDPVPNGYFGYSVAVSGDRAVIGSPALVPGDAGFPVGRAYMFLRSGGRWTQQQKLTASDAAAGDAFGFFVAVSGDSAVVGALGHGAAYVYERDFRLTALSPARVWIGLKNSDDVGIRFGLQAKVSLKGALIGVGELTSVPGGSSGFNNAALSSIPLTLAAPVPFSPGDRLEIEVLARNACSSSGKNSGTARLWYNGSAVDSGTTRDAGSRFDATIGGMSGDYFLRGNFELIMMPGSSRLLVDRAVGAKCGDFVSFGTWSATLP